MNFLFDTRSLLFKKYLNFWIFQFFLKSDEPMLISQQSPTPPLQSLPPLSSTVTTTSISSEIATFSCINSTEPNGWCSRNGSSALNSNGISCKSPHSTECRCHCMVTQCHKFFLPDNLAHLRFNICEKKLLKLLQIHHQSPEQRYVSIDFFKNLFKLMKLLNYEP